MKELIRKNDVYPPSAKTGVYASKIVFEHTGKFLIIADSSAWWKIRQGKKEKAAEFTTRPDNYNKGIAISQNNKIAVAAGEIVFLLDENGVIEHKFELTKKPAYWYGFQNVAINREGNLIAAATYGGNTQIIFWRSDGAIVKILEHKSFGSEGAAMVFSNDQEFLFTYASGNLIKINLKNFDVEQIPLIETFSCNKISIADNGYLVVQFERYGWACISPQNKIISSCSARFNSDQNEYFSTYPNGLKQKGGTQSAVISPDGKFVLEGYEKTITVRNSETLAVELSIIRKKRAEVRDIAVTPDGWIAVGTDGGVEFYDMHKPPEITEPEIDIKKIGDGDIYELKGPKGEIKIQRIIKSSEKENESKHLRIDSELKLLNGEKWIKIFHAYSHGSYADGDEIVLEDGDMENKGLKAAKKILGTKLDLYDLAVFLANTSPEPEAYKLALENSL